MGWGALEEDGASPDVLHEVVVDHIPNGICNDSEHYDGLISDTMICAGFENGGKDSCQGDSGGPMIVKRDNEFYQVGIVSWGSGCAAPSKPGVYADVEALLGWTYSNGFNTGFDTNKFDYYLLDNPVQTISTKFQNGLEEELYIIDIVITNEEVGITINSNSCNNSTIQPGQFCEIEVQLAGEVKKGSFILSSNIGDQHLPEFSKKIYYQKIPKSEIDMSAHMSIPTSIEWYTGGDEKWLAENTLFEDDEQPVLMSGPISHNSETILIAEIKSDRFLEFSFDYLPSTERFYDFLTIYHNETEVINVSGVNEDFQSFHIDLDEGTDLIIFKYEKDGTDSGGNDNVILKSLDFPVENESPILSVLESDISVRSELEFILDASLTSDPDGDEVYFSWVDLSQEDIVISTDALVTIKAPRVEEDTTVNYEITVTDEIGGKSTEQVIVNILKNEAPNVTLTTNVSSAARGDTIIFDASASNDPEGDALTYSWVQTGDSFVVVSNASSTLEFVAPSLDNDTTYSFAITVTDSFGDSNTQESSVTVLKKKSSGSFGMLWMIFMGVLLYNRKFDLAH